MNQSKKLLSVILAFTMLFTLSLSVIAVENASTENTVIKLQIGNSIMTVNGAEQAIDENGTVPIVQDNRTLLPVRAVVEAMGGNVEWDGATETATLLHKNNTIKLTIGSTTAYLNNAAKTLDVTPVIINNRTMLPIRFVAESFGFHVGWDGETQTVTLTSSNSTINPPKTGTKTLVAYFSMPETTDPNNMTTEEANSTVVIDGEVLGNTQYVAYVIKENTNADIFRIEPKTPYPINHATLVDLAKEEQNNNARPELLSNIENLDEYDVIFLGYPNWWGDLPMVLYTFLETHDLSGKTIIPFNTHGGSGFSDTINTIARLQPNATVERNGLTISRNNVQESEADIIAWVNTFDIPKNTNTNAFNFETKTVTLNNGIEMPIIGIGTFSLQPAQAEESVYHALLYGYRLIDTANAYMNERAVGRGIKKSGVPREEIFVTSKLWVSEYDRVAEAIDETLARLDLEYIDLLLLHQPYGNHVGAYQELEKAVSEGKVRSIGLSNTYKDKFDKIMSVATIPPAVLQNERNPYIQQTEMQEYIKPYGTVIEAWFPLGGRSNSSNRQQSLFNDEIILGIAQAHNKTAAQIILRWHLQSGGIAIPGSSNPAHILENISIFDFELTADEMQRISTLDTDELIFDHRNPDEEANTNAYSRPMDFNSQE